MQIQKEKEVNRHFTEDLKISSDDSEEEEIKIKHHDGFF